ncbi:MAG: hypothetical protein EHM72_00750 [Calditrichaeota bacterium]|nr:MAG: hypothetical protein EHM72_00750 [Calditrichota bacterium]
MIKEDLIKRSPIRTLEKTLGGGLQAGQLGVITAWKGVGKTASLVHIATDILLRGQNVLHVSFADDSRHIIGWYEQVFREVARANKLDNAQDVHDEIIRHRLILHFKNFETPFAEIKKHISQVESSWSDSPRLIIVDGFQFDKITKSFLLEWKEYAAEHQVGIWFSATVHRDNSDVDEFDIPAPINAYRDQFQVIILLEPLKEVISFKLLKCNQLTNAPKLQLRLDPKTLLISNHRV